MSIRRVNIPVKEGFDPESKDHRALILKRLEEQTGAVGWKYKEFDVEKGIIAFEHRPEVSSVRSEGDRSVVNLGADLAKPSDGERADKQFKASEWGKRGYVMTVFDPFNGTAVLEKLSPKEQSARDALSTAVGVKPWEVRVGARKGGGFNAELPRGYVSSKHDIKIEEAVEKMIGEPGWYVKYDRAARQIEIIPSKLPTFPGGIAYPASNISDFSSQDRLLFGKALGPNGDQEGDLTFIEFSDGPHTMLQGTSGSGKSVTINALLAGAVASGMELVVVDVPAKAVDFTWCREFVRPGGWGCESLEEGLAALDRVYREGQRRAGVLKQYDVQKLSELPAHERAGMQRIFIVTDELAGILRKVNIPKALPKDNPIYLKAERDAIVRDLTLDRLLRIAAEMRFVGLHLLLSTQVANVNTGIPTELRDNCSNKLLMGISASERVRNTALNSPELAPPIPANIREDGDVGKGVGIAELPGMPSRIFKGLFATTSDLAAAMARSGVKSIGLDEARPSLYDVERAMGELDEVSKDFSGPPLANDPDAGAVDENGRPLKGAAAAAAASKRYSA